ncbi:MAG: PssD/Cps14F family polysaccharide biosynthesis glycosyltransferase [Planctomycetota bacterium]|jgi:UDP-N-acetylglucosamine:LPS N-acetylglucosamine transferase
MPKKDKNKSIKVAVICSPGGHFEQAMMVLEAFKDCRVLLVTYDFPTFKDFQHPDFERIYRLKYFGDSNIQVFITLLFSCFTYIRIFLKERPQVIFSTGSEIAIPAFYIGKFIFGLKLIYLETILRMHHPTVAARTLYWISDLFLVQWESLLPKFGNKAKYAGKIL